MTLPVTQFTYSGIISYLQPRQESENKQHSTKAVICIAILDKFKMDPSHPPVLFRVFTGSLSIRLISTSSVTTSLWKKTSVRL